MEARRRFAIALSFAGEQRAKTVEPVAQALARQYTQERVLYDHFHREEFARPNLNVHLPNLYRAESELVVVVLSPDYPKKKWCGLELRFIRELIENQPNRVMLLAVGDPGDLSHLGILPGDGYLSLDSMSPKKIAASIVKRYDQETGKLEKYGVTVEATAEDHGKNPGMATTTDHAEDPSSGHTPAGKAFWKKLLPVWGHLKEIGYLSAIQAEFPDSRVEQSPVVFYCLCVESGVDPYKLLIRLRRALSEVAPDRKVALLQLPEPVRKLLTSMALAVSERCIREHPATRFTKDETTSNGLNVSVEQTISAYLIAAAWLGLSPYIEFENGSLMAPACIETFNAPSEYKCKTPMDSIRAAVLALGKRFEVFQPSNPGSSLPSPRLVRELVLEDMEKLGIGVVLAVRAGETDHILADPRIREQAHDELRLPTVIFGLPANTDDALEVLLTDLTTLIMNLSPGHPSREERRITMKSDQSTESPSSPTYIFNAPVGKVGDGNGDSVAQANAPGSQAAARDIHNASQEGFDQLLDAFLVLARAHAAPEIMERVEAQAKEIKEAVADPDRGPKSAKLLKYALDGLETLSKGVDNGAKLLEKLAPVKDWLLSSWDSLALLYNK
ncbi:MAG: hypothetical protein Q8O33_04730 [Pseudomonadota bacterium]|nr:hypothetical protein [Pseudomonadota bacterium]